MGCPPNDSCTSLQPLTKRSNAHAPQFLQLRVGNGVPEKLSPPHAPQSFR